MSDKPEPLDEDSFTALVKLYDKDLVRYCYVIAGDRQLAEDAVQNAWQKLWARQPLRDRSKVRGWLTVVAANEVRQLQRKRRRTRLVEDRAVADLSRLPPNDGDQIQIADILDRLDPSDRQLLGLKYIVGLDSEEIGEVLGLSAEGARTRLHRLLGRLRRDYGR